MSFSSQSRTIDLPALAVRAAITASSIDDEARTVEVVFSTGAAVRRFDWATGERYVEKLSLDPAHVRLDRLNAGGPVLDSHNGYSLGSVLGVVEDGTAKATGKKGLATLRFSRRAEVEPFWSDVKDRVIRNVSVGYVVHAYNETPGKNGAPPTRTAIDWEPYEISMVPMPADAGAQTRDGKKPDLHPCVIHTRAAEENGIMEPTNQQSEFIVEDAQPRLGLAAETPAPAEVSERDLGAAAENERVQGILLACDAARLPRSFAKRLIADKAITLVKAQTMVFEHMQHVTDPNQAPQAASRRVEVGDDPRVHERAGIVNAILNRCSPQHFKLDDRGREYRGMSLLDIGRMFLNAAGIRTTGLSKLEIAGAALGMTVRGGYHATSDFALLLADVANKTLRAAYDELPQTFRAIARQANLPDFKPVYRNQLGDAPQLLLVGQGGEFLRGTIGEARETYQLATYGRIFAISRQALVNDDLSAFSRVPADFGREARNLESNLVWEQITANAAMGDTFNLFSSQHANIDSVGAVISVEAIGAGRAAIRKQRGLGSADQPGHRLNLSPAFLIVPASLETKADRFVAQVVPNKADNVNPFSGGRLSVIAEPRLDDDSELSWYLGAPGEQIASIEYGYLEGQEGPIVESMPGWNVDGVELKCRLDFAAKVIDYRGLYKNVGAEEAS